MLWKGEPGALDLRRLSVSYDSASAFTEGVGYSHVKIDKGVSLRMIQRVNPVTPNVSIHMTAIVLYAQGYPTC